MSILNVNQIQPVGSGQTVTISATNVDAGSATVTAGTFSGNLSSSGISTFSDTVNVGAGKSIRLYGATSGYSEIIAAAGSASTTFTLPANGGSASQYLQTDGAGVLSWATVTSPEILQVVHALNETQGSVINTAATSYNDTGLSATITPVAAGSSILIFVSQYHYILTSTINTASGRLKIRRGTTDLKEYQKGIYKTDGGSGAHALWGNVCVTYLDTPTYTLGNSVSYNTQVKSDNSNNCTLTWNTTPSTMVLMEIKA